MREQRACDHEKENSWPVIPTNNRVLVQGEIPEREQPPLNSGKRCCASDDIDGQCSDGEVQRLPLWLSRPQADVLSKMIDFILKRQPITTESRALLQELLPLVSDLRDELVGLSVAEDEIIE